MGSRPWSGFQLTLEYFWLRDVQIPPTLYLDSSNRHWTLTVHQEDIQNREDHKNGIFDNTCIKKEFGINRDSELFSSISNKRNQNNAWRWGGRGRWSKPDKNWFQHRFLKPTWSPQMRWLWQPRLWKHNRKLCFLSVRGGWDSEKGSVNLRHGGGLMERHLSSDGKMAPEILYRSGANNSSDMLREVDGLLTRAPGRIYETSRTCLRMQEQLIRFN